MIRKFINDEEIISIAKDLVALDSHVQEDEVAEYIMRFFAKEGISSNIDIIEKKRPNVYGVIKGDIDINALMFNGHMDVVPGINMDFEPFKPFVEEDRLYGRGAVDMKGGLAAMIGAMTAVKRSNIKLKKSVMFAGVIDEEEKSMGTEKMISDGIRAERVIIGEPTQLKVTVAHKGVESIKVTFTGKSGHASTPKESINAIYIAADFIKLVHEELEPMIESRGFEYLGSGSICVSIIEAGSVANVVPGTCTVSIDRRWLPNETVESIMDEIGSIAQKAVDSNGGSFVVKREELSKAGNTPHYIDHKSRYVNDVLNIVSNKTGVEQTPVGFPAWTDAALMNNVGNMDCIILGPGNVKQAHTNNEFCEIDQIIKATDIYIGLIEEFCL